MVKNQKQKSVTKKGISLIVLVITIIVIIILAAAVILALNSNNPITNAKKASFQSDVRSFQDELSLYIADQYARNMGVLDLNTINAQDAEITNKYIKSMKPKYYPILEVVNGKLVVRGTAPTGDEKQWAEEILGGSTTGGGESDSDFGDNGSVVENVAKVNKPVLTTGLTPIIFDETAGEYGKPIPVESADSNWYVYVGNTSPYKTDDTNNDTLRVSKWANAQSADGSQWVWIPRYAYKIPSGAGTSTASPIEVVFLRGTSDEYYDQATGTYLTAKRAGEAGAGITEYMVHPAFTNENNSTQANALVNNGFQNGGWDFEITGIWVSKYEAGDSLTPKDASFVYGGSTTTKKYPAFKPNLNSYANIDIGDSYALSRVLNSSNNPYGLTTSADTHLIKNSEWGAVAYLTQSKYGRNGNRIRVNSINSGGSSSSGNERGLTGGGTVDNSEVSISSVTADNRYNGKYGKLASTTGNLYGVYDMSGGNYEYTAGHTMFVDDFSEAGRKMTDLNNDGVTDDKPTKHIPTYYGSTEYYKFDEIKNSKKKGDALIETSWWNEDYGFYNDYGENFFMRGGSCSLYPGSGIFNYYDTYGGATVWCSFRSSIVLPI